MTSSDELQLWSEIKRLSFAVEAQTPFSPPGLEKSDDGSLAMTAGEWSSEAQRLHELLYELEIVSPEHVPGDDYRLEPDVDVTRLSVVELNQFLTAVCRGDRFVDGLLSNFVNSHAVTKAIRRLYLLTVCDETGWPRAFPMLSGREVPEGIEVRSLSGTLVGRTSGGRAKCRSKGCPGWFVYVRWETGQPMQPCSEGWHYDPDQPRIDVIGGGEVSARFVSPKPLGTPPAPRESWPTRERLARWKGWRVPQYRKP
ncbi:MAG: DUF6508 domain-containing protein [Acidimicrobiia bacterium]